MNQIKRPDGLDPVGPLFMSARATWVLRPISRIGRGERDATMSIDSSRDALVNGPA